MPQPLGLREPLKKTKQKNTRLGAFQNWPTLEQAGELRASPLSERRQRRFHFRF
jgi:hypothetical protein